MRFSVERRFTSCSGRWCGDGLDGLLEVALAFGYVHALDSVMVERINRIYGILVGLVEGER